jgi:hypothetical protein
LIGIAVDPKFVSNGYIYLSYVADAPNQTRDADEPRITATRKPLKSAQDKCAGYSL